MTTQRTTLAYQRGERFRQAFKWTDAAGSNVPLGGVSFLFTVKKKGTGAVLLTRSTSQDRFEVTDEAAGEFRLDLTTGDTEVLDAGAYVYELDADEGNGYVKRLASGRLNIYETGDPAVCPALITLACDPVGVEVYTVTTLTNDFSIAQGDAPFLVAAESESVVPQVASGSATVAKVGEFTAAASDGSTLTVSLYAFTGNDGTYSLRGT